MTWDARWVEFSFDLYTCIITIRCKEYSVYIQFCGLAFTTDFNKGCPPHISSDYRVIIFFDNYRLSLPVGCCHSV
jgi:hypothetical protein